MAGDMEKNKKRLKLSVIIPSWERQDTLEKSLQLLEPQIDLSQMEILIVQGSKGAAEARNRAIKKAKGEILLFLNDDSWVCAGLVQRHLTFHQKFPENNCGLVGLTENHPDTVKKEAMKWLAGQSGLHFNYRFEWDEKYKEIPWYYLWTCNLSLKSNFLKTNQLFFDETFPKAAWEDIEFGYRASQSGLRLFFDGQARVWHFHEMGINELKQRFFSHGQGLRHLCHKLPANFLPPLVKSKWGEAVLGVMHYLLPAKVEEWLTKYLGQKNIYPNWLMQLLVIKWKSEGYYHEKNK